MGADYLAFWAMPNFYFHVTTTYTCCVPVVWSWARPTFWGPLSARRHTKRFARRCSRCLKGLWWLLRFGLRSACGRCVGLDLGINVRSLRRADTAYEGEMSCRPGAAKRMRSSRDEHGIPSIKATSLRGRHVRPGCGACAGSLVAVGDASPHRLRPYGEAFGEAALESDDFCGPWV